MEIEGVSKAIIYIQPQRNYPYVIINLCVLDSNSKIIRWNGNSAEVSDVEYSDSFMEAAFDWLTTHYNMPDGYEDWTNDGYKELEASELQTLNCIEL